MFYGISYSPAGWPRLVLRQRQGLRETYRLGSGTVSCQSNTAGQSKSQARPYSWGGKIDLSLDGDAVVISPRVWTQEGWSPVVSFAIYLPQ